MGTMEIKLSGNNNLSTIVDEEDYWTFRLSDYRWLPTTNGSRAVYVRANKNGKQIILHRLIMGLLDSPRSVFVDHKDHNGLNNSRTNLRVTNNMGNQRNARKQLSAKNTSTHKGVSFDRNKKTNPWRAGIMLSGKAKYLGHYRTQEEAARSYNEAATKYYGTMAYLNIIEPDNKK